MSENTKQQNEDNRKAVLTARSGGALDALKKARDRRYKKDNIRTIRVKDDDGSDLLVFRVRGLTEGEYTKARKEAAERKRNGLEEVDPAMERAQIIYTATVDEDKPLWDSREITEEFDTRRPRDVIDEIFGFGEKLNIVNVIDELSGFGQDNETIDVLDEVKN